jgi:hypothetical protein
MVSIYKGYQIKTVENLPRCFTIVTDGRGGKIPNVLQGVYTSVGRAQQQIDTYLISKETSDGKAASKS